jgi:hypothetical protein
MFDQLPASQRERLLTTRWDKIENPALLPLVRSVARGAASERHLVAAALRRWHELDPAGARPFILQEIARPEPRFGAPELGLLPDETLPEVDQLLVQHLASAPDSQTATNIASLISRYASAAILPQILEMLDQRSLGGDCAIQNPLLACVLRVSPEAARPRIEHAIAAPQLLVSGCNQTVLSEVGARHYHPVLEEVALRALDHDDGRVATDAATTLGKFGSAAAEPALWELYERWSKRLAEEAPLSSDAGDERRYMALATGSALLQAVATGHGWLTDPGKLQRLASLTTHPDVRVQIESYLRSWNAKRPTVTIRSSGTEFQGGVAHYHYDSLPRLREKLAQFPAGTGVRAVADAGPSFSSSGSSGDRDPRVSGQPWDAASRSGRRAYEVMLSNCHDFL